MTKYEWPEPIPDWDLLKWKDEIQLQIYEETKAMTSEEAIEYFRKKAELFDNDIAERRLSLSGKRRAGRIVASG